MVKLSVTLRLLLMASGMTICLCSCGGSGSSSPTAAVSAAKTAAWTNVSVRALDGTVNINWDKAAGAALGTAVPTYNIYCSTSPTGIMQVGNRIVTNYAGQSFDHTNVTNGQRYYYVVTEVTAAGEGPASLTVSATPQAVQPAAPYGLMVTAQDSSATLTFMGPTLPGTTTVSYNLYRSTARNSFTASNIIASQKPASALNPYTDPNLSNGTTYYYAVTAVVAGKESGFSPVVSAQPQAAVPAVAAGAAQVAAFGAPTGMSAQPGNGSCVISWTDVAPIALSSGDPAASTTPDYILYWSNSPDVLNNATGQIDSATKDATSGGYKLTGLNNGTVYYFQLAAAVKGADGNPIPGRFTSGTIVSATPAPATPAIPSGVSATQGPQQVSLTWTKDTSGIPGVIYNIYVSTTDAATPAQLMAIGTKKNNPDSTKAYYVHSGLQTGQTYYYVVTAVGEGESAPSNIISVTL